MREPKQGERSIGWPIMVQAGPDGGSHFAVPSEFAPRFLFPADKAAAKIGAQFFLPPLKRLRLRWQTLTARLLSGNGRSGLSQTALMAAIQEPLNEPGLQSVVAMGTSGPYSKPTVLLLGRGLAPIAIAKVGVTKAAASLVKNEAYWLASLGNDSSFSGAVPRLIASRQAGDVHILIQSVGGKKQLVSTFTDMHATFLSRLQDFHVGSRDFGGSEMRRQMERRIEDLDARLSPSWRQRAKRTIHKLATRLGDERLPMVAAHRDFVPWNMQSSDQGLFVFDWEFASDGYLPLYDLFHFRLMPRVLKRNISRNQLHRLLTEVVADGLRLKGGRNKTVAPKAQLLAYLLDLSLFYLESNQGDDSGDIVVQRYGHLIDALAKAN